MGAPPPPVEPPAPVTDAPATKALAQAQAAPAQPPAEAKVGVVHAAPSSAPGPVAKVPPRTTLGFAKTEQPEALHEPARAKGPLMPLWYSIVFVLILIALLLWWLVF